jgi:hypothetical protein
MGEMRDRGERGMKYERWWVARQRVEMKERRTKKLKERQMEERRGK